MLIIDAALKQREVENNPVKVALVGAGFMGRGLVNQVVNSTPGMRLVAICNRTQANAERAYLEAGVQRFTVVNNAVDLDRVVRAGGYAITSNYEAVC